MTIESVDEVMDDGLIGVAVVWQLQTEQGILNLLRADVEGLTVEEGWVEGEGADYEFTASVLLTGETATNEFTITPKDGTLMDNYELTKTEGTLSIKDRSVKYSITVTAASSNNTYDGNMKSAKGFEEPGLKVVIDGNTYKISGLKTSDPERIDATTGNGIENAITGTAVVTDAAGNDVTSQFTVKTESGWLKIARRPATITVANTTKDYGVKDEDITFNAAHTSGGVNEDLPATWTVRRTNKAEDPGTYNGVLTLKDYAGTIDEIKAKLEEEYPNYIFTIIPGNFTIRAADTHSLTVTYMYSDGTVDYVFNRSDYAEGDNALAKRKIPDGYTATIRRTSQAALGGRVTENVDDTAHYTTISGTMGNADVTYEVIYTLNDYRLTIHFQVLGEEEILATIYRDYPGGTVYSVLRTDEDIPADKFPEGYVMVERKDLKMPLHDDTIIVYLVPEGYTLFDDDPTPLGINDAALGSGEIIE